jgi:hypothetical protein
MVLWEGMEGGDNLRNLIIDRRIILQWSLKEYVWRMWTGFNWLSIVFIGKLFSNAAMDLSVSLKVAKFLIIRETVYFWSRRTLLHAVCAVDEWLLWILVIKYVCLQKYLFC